MKIKLMMATLAMIALPALVQAQAQERARPGKVIDQRQANLERRIDKGGQARQLNAREVVRRETPRARRAQNVESARIDRPKHDAQKASR